jgi:hypothetical protein
MSSLIELRQYTLHPGQREKLIDIFDREFVESQEALGIEVLGQFRDIDRPDVFTWLRGFPDMESRRVSLTAFYEGPVWREHCDAANATMITWNNVCLLRPTHSGSGFTVDSERDRPAESLVLGTLYPLEPRVAPSFRGLFDEIVRPELTAAGAESIATYETESSANTYPRLPIRENERLFAWFAQFPSVSAYREHERALGGSYRWRNAVVPAIETHLASPPEIHRLAPTTRSRLR